MPRLSDIRAQRLRPGLTRASLGAVLPLLALSATIRSQTFYDFGNPGPEEQHHIELINRARANPPLEGARMAADDDPDVLAAYSAFRVDLAMMEREFQAIAPLPPLAPNASLTAAARGHSRWMLEHAVQTHNQTDPANTPHDRIIAAGYLPSATGENVAAYSTNPWHGHASFQVDWGTGGSGGMQPGRGHRANIHHASYREIGVGVINGTNGGVGPQLVTQDFGAPRSGTCFGTGVAYYDLNENQFYDPGEGIADLWVSVEGSSQACRTAEGGGWAVPVPAGQALRNVTFFGLGLSQSVPMQLPASGNAKADLRLSYTAPVITSGASGTSGVSQPFTFTAVAGASSYQWSRWPLRDATPENAEDAARIRSSTTGSYSVVQTQVAHQGNAAFHLENSTADSQSIQLDRLFLGQTSPQLAFYSRIRQSTASERFKVQIRIEGSSVWQDVDHQTGGTPEDAFSLRTVPIPAATGRLFRIRFLLEFSGGSYYPQSGRTYGWFIDAITLDGISQAGTPSSQWLAGTSATFTPDPGPQWIEVSPVISGRPFPAAHQLFSAAEIPLSSNARLAALSLGNGTLQPAFEDSTTNYAASVGYAVSSITLQASAADHGASIKINGELLRSGTTSSAIPLAVGTNTLRIVVKAPNGTTLTYRISVTRKTASDSAPRLAALRVQGLALTPSFQPHTRFYRTLADPAATSVRVIARSRSADTNMRVNGTRLLSGQASPPIPLNPSGNTDLRISLTAPDGTRRLYRIEVGRK